MCGFDRRIGGSTPTLSFLDGPPHGRYAADARTLVTEAVVIGPGRAVLFYGRHSMGEGLTRDKARDATFLFTGAGTWVGKSAYLTADPMTIQEDRRAIAQAVSDCQVKVRGPGHPCVNLPAQQPFWFDPLRASPLKDVPGDGGSDCNHHLIGPQEIENIIDIGETKGLNHLCSPHLPQIMGLRATRVGYQWLPQCHLGLTGQMDPNAPEEVDGFERMELA